MAAKDQSNGEPERANNGSLLLSLLNSPDRLTRSLAIVLIIVTGIGNWFSTETNGHQNREEIRRALKEINEIYSELDDSIRREKEILDLLHKH
jgi:hypothetical protein